MQLPPSYSVSSIVKHYLILRKEGDMGSSYRLFSDGNPGIVFHLKDPLTTGVGSSEKVQPRSFLYGQITHFNDIKSAGALDMLIVVLQPTAVHALLGIPAMELNNSTIPLVDLFGQGGADLEEQVLSSRNRYDAIKYIENMLISRLSRSNYKDLIITEVLNLIDLNNGIISIADILKELPVTERQLERKFRQYIGTAPKKFIDIIKFQHFLKSLQKHSPKEKIADIIYHCGYYDQAHLNNYFKKSAGITPKQYRSNDHLLAINFMRVG